MPIATGEEDITIIGKGKDHFSDSKGKGYLK